MSAAPYPLEPEEHRRARHLYMLKRLAERAFDLTLRAADAAEAEMAAPEPEPEPEPAAPAPDPHRTFQRYAALVRLLVSTEHRIATGAPARPARRSYRAADSGPVDSRRAKIIPWIHLATRGAPERAALHDEAETTLDEALAGDPDNGTSMAEILAEICRTHGLPFDVSKLPDEFLETATTGPPRIPQDEATRARIRQLALRSASA